MTSLPFIDHFAGVIALVSCAGENESEFSRADLNNDQRVTTDQIEGRLVEAISKKEDQNRDDRVTSAKWTQVNPNSKVTLFTARDTNGDEVVDLKGFQEYADSSGVFDKVWTQLDPNEDGFGYPTEADKVLGSTSH